MRNSKFCKSHHRAAENMKYQAQNAKPPELTSYNQVMNDPSKAKIAIEDFMRDNPEGSGRKRLIDWAAWKRDHGVRLSYTVREGEELLDIDDYYVMRSLPRGKSRAESDAAFKELLQGLMIEKVRVHSRSFGCQSTRRGCVIGHTLWKAV